MKWLIEAILMAAVAFLKAIPAIGFAPWACALVDAAFLMLLLAAGQREKVRTVSVACVLMPVFDWLQGSIPGYWIPFMALGGYMAALIWARMPVRRPARAVLSALAAYMLRVCGVAIGYILIKEMSFGPALRSVVRNSWFVFAWYIGLIGLHAAADAWFAVRKNKNVPHA